MKDTLWATVSFTFMAAACAGWIMNIVAIFNGSFEPVTGEMVVRIIGVFLAPIGAIMGWV